MKCFYCKGDIRPGKTVYAVQFGDNVVVVKNVPCEECAQCGQIEISDEVMQRLEKIVAFAKRMVQEVAVIDYAMAA